MKIKYLAEVLRDTSETAYTTTFSRVYNTRKAAENAIKDRFGDVKYVKEIYCE